MSETQSTKQNLYYNRIGLISDGEYSALAIYLAEVVGAPRAMIVINDLGSPFVVTSVGSLKVQPTAEAIMAEAARGDIAANVSFYWDTDKVQPGRCPGHPESDLTYWGFPIRGSQGELLGCLSLIMDKDSLLSNEQKRLVLLGVRFLSSKLEWRKQSDLLIQATQPKTSQEADFFKTAEMLKFKTLGEITAGIAHEINNPLSIIQGRANQMIALAKREELPTTEVVRLAESIVSVVKRISKIIMGIKSIVHSSDSEPFERVQVKDMIDSTLEFCREKIRAQKVDLRLRNIPDDLILECRQVQVSQVILNLVLNALDAIANNAEKWITLEVVKENGWVSIMVIDSGNSIPEALQHRLFEPYFTTKGIGKGTGLGLSISKKIVETHGGDLKINCSYSNTCFQIRLPQFQS